MNRCDKEPEEIYYNMGYDAALDRVLEIIDKEVDGDLGKLSTQTARIRAAILAMMRRTE